MLKRLLLAAILLLPEPALAAITNVASLGADGTSVSGSTIVVTMDAALDQHNVVVVRIGSDNIGAADGDNDDVTGIVDTGGNTYEKICEYTYAEGGAGNGATVSLWTARAATALAISDTITITLASSIGSRVAQAQAYDVTDGNKLQIAGACKTENQDSAEPGSLTTDTLPSKEYLFYRAIAWESGAGAISSHTATYATVIGVAINTGVNATSMTTDAERLIATTTASTSDPSVGASLDGASIFVALEECTPGVNCTGDATRRPISPMFMQ